MDQGILNRIKENEQEYHATVMKYLKHKEEELKTVLRRLDEKNNQQDGKDMLIAKLHTMVNKIEGDGHALLKRLSNNQGQNRLIKDSMEEMHRDKDFLVDKVRKEKRKSRAQANFIRNLTE